MSEYHLQGKRALVDGASKGIGKAVALLLAEKGAEVVGVSRSVSICSVRRSCCRPSCPV